MDPYLERPTLWPGVHALLITGVATRLGPRVAPNYYVAVEERTYIASADPTSFMGRPDVVLVGPQRSPGVALPGGNGGSAVLERPLTLALPMPDQVRERYLEIRDSATHQVVTVIEVLSPSNKQPGEGRQQYERKRLHMLASWTSLVEIDLLRGWEPMPLGAAPASDYRFLVSRSWLRPEASLYPFDVNEPIPNILIPLREKEPEPTLELNELLHSLYDQVRYDLRIDYRSEPDPPLAPDKAEWAQRLLQVAGLLT
jgi:hypothetical protein